LPGLAVQDSQSAFGRRGQADRHAQQRGLARAVALLCLRGCRSAEWLR
jgi:hypothetical protein